MLRKLSRVWNVNIRNLSSSQNTFLRVLGLKHLSCVLCIPKSLFQDKDCRAVRVNMFNVDKLAIVVRCTTKVLTHDVEGLLYYLNKLQSYMETKTPY